MIHTHVNIDGDVLRYSAGFAAEDEPVTHLYSTLNSMVRGIVEACQAETFTVLLTGKGNFREEVATIRPYKGNRTGRKPDNFDEATEFLILNKDAIVVTGEEADDQLGIRAMAHGHTIATIDKDLDNVPGWHYNWQRKELYYITPLQAMHHFFTQLLTGDRVDNIPGLFAMTGKKATKNIKGAVAACTTPEECYAHVFMTYNESTDEPPETVKAWLLEIGRLLWIRHKENEMWEPPILKEIPA